jgi:hypothetical protein
MTNWNETKYFDTVEEEKAYTNKFCKENTFPSYRKMSKLMDTVAKVRPDMAGKIMEWGCEYGEFNHECCKKMYDSGFDKAVCREMGEIIHQRGGFQAMWANFYILCWFSPCGWEARKYENMVLTSAPKMLEYHWDGIGDWQS